MTLLDQVIAGQAPPLVPLTVDQYHKMIARGILPEGAPIELIDGLLVRKDRSDRGGNPMSHGPGHVAGVRRLNRQFRPVEERGYLLHSQLPVTLDENGEPEPDLTLVRGQEADFVRRLPSAKDIAAAMEVADSSLTYDRTTKLRIYAVAAIPVYWIVNLVDRQIEVYEKPRPDGTYAVCNIYKLGQKAKLLLEPGLEIDVAMADVIPV